MKIKTNFYFSVLNIGSHDIGSRGLYVHAQDENEIWGTIQSKLL